MIQEFSIKNFLSFNEEQTISFEASKDKTYDDYSCYEIKPGIKLLKLAVIYGANASGKTNILQAIDFLRDLIVSPNETKKDKIYCIPFLLNDSSRKTNTELKLIFYINQIKYSYYVSLNQSEITQEILLYYPSTRPALIFERNKNETNVDIKFGSTIDLKSFDKKILIGNTISNISVIAGFSKSNIKSELLDTIYKWFTDNLLKIITPTTDLYTWTSERIEEKENCKDTVLDLLNEADFNISDIRIEEKKIEVDSKISEMIDNIDMPPHVREEIQEKGHFTAKQIDFLHQTDNFSNFFSNDSESKGTLRYYGLGGVLDKLLTSSSILLVDELDSSLHPDLVKHFLKTYLANTEQSQLIFTTHNIELLNEDYLRRDSIWFCEKGKDGATETYSALDFGLHKNNSIYNAYKIGRLGAIPQLGDIHLKRKNNG